MAHETGITERKKEISGNISPVNIYCKQYGSDFEYKTSSSLEHPQNLSCDMLSMQQGNVNDPYILYIYDELSGTIKDHPLDPLV